MKIRRLLFWIAASLCAFGIASIVWIRSASSAIRVVSANSEVTWNESALGRILPHSSPSNFPWAVPESINVQHVPSDPEGFVRALGRLPNTLQSATISIGNDPVAPLVIDQLIRMNGLSALKVYGCQINDSCLARLAELPRLESLALSGNEQSFHQFPALSHLEALELDATKLDKEGLLSVLKVQTLRELSIVGNALDFNSLLNVHWNNPSLAELILGHVGEVSPDQIRALVDTIKKGCPKIEAIYLNNQNVYR